MNTFQHSFHILRSPATIVDALTQELHLQRWWTNDSSVKRGKGVFHWPENNWTVKLMVDSEGKNSVTWECTESNMQNTSAWVGSTMSFQLAPDDSGGTKIHFTHTNYKDSPCFSTCSENWRHALGTSLKSYMETGRGMPSLPSK